MDLTPMIKLFFMNEKGRLIHKTATKHRPNTEQTLNLLPNIDQALNLLPNIDQTLNLLPNIDQTQNKH